MFSNSRFYTKLLKKEQKLVLDKISEIFLYTNTPVETLRTILETLDPPLEIRDNTTLVINVYTLGRIKKSIQRLTIQQYTAVQKKHTDT